MIRNKLFGLSLIFALIISVGLIGCTSDDDDDTQPPAGSGGGGGTPGTPDGNNTFTGVLRSNLDESPIPGCTVKALNNSTLEELGVETVTDIEGKFTLSGLPAGEMCVFAVGEMGGDYPRIDTYTYNVETNEQNRDIYSIPMTVAEMIDNGLCGPARTDVGGASGAVYYLNEAGEEFEVDCATVEVEHQDPNADTSGSVVYYFSGGLPSVGDQAEPCDRPDIGAGRLLETSANGRFYATEMPPGMVNLTAYVDGQPIGSTTLKVTAPADATGGQYNSNITRIYADEPGDPTPNCVQEQ